MGAGVAAVVVAGPAQDYVTGGETGIVCESGDPAALCKAIDSLLSDRPHARRVAEQALEYVRTHHPISAMAEKCAEVFRRLALSHATFSMKES
jgi:glycosyltransferase involved in cell wall biosynthesis